MRRCTMSSVKNQLFGSFSGNIPVVITLVVLLLAGGAPARPQNEKRTVFTENDFHWQANLKPGQTLEIIGRNGGIDASGATGDAAQVEGIKESHSDGKEVFVEVVEYADGVTICSERFVPTPKSAKLANFDEYEGNIVDEWA